MARADSGIARLPPKLETPARTQAAVWCAVFAFAGFAGFVVLFLFNPAEHAFYPRCAFHSLTGLLCPGCGGLRAMHQLLHGHLAAAWELNPLAVLLVPLFLWGGASWVLRVTWQQRLPMPRFNGRTAWLGVALLVAFGILRNVW